VKEVGALSGFAKTSQKKNINIAIKVVVGRKRGEGGRGQIVQKEAPKLAEKGSAELVDIWLSGVVAEVLEHQ